jgi:hypothetical protein
MHLRFGPIEIDTKGLPPAFAINVDLPLGAGKPVAVDIFLAGARRGTVQRWAKRLGVESTERDVPPAHPSDPLRREAEAVVEAGGYKVSVWTRFAADTLRNGSTL